MRTGNIMQRRTSIIRRPAFTLVEVLIVVIILGILAAAVIPQFTDAADETRLNSTAIITKSIQRKITEEFTRTNVYPTTIDPAWFEGGVLPAHPENSVGVATVEVVNSAGTFHPANKVLKAGVAGAFWYNRAEGIIRARVTERATQPATSDAYNFANNSSEADMGNFGDGGGGGGGS